MKIVHMFAAAAGLGALAACAPAAEENNLAADDNTMVVENLVVNDVVADNLMNDMNAMDMNAVDMNATDMNVTTNATTNTGY